MKTILKKEEKIEKQQFYFAGWMNEKYPKHEREKYN